MRDSEGELEVCRRGEKLQTAVSSKPTYTELYHDHGFKALFQKVKNRKRDLIYLRYISKIIYKDAQEISYWG